MAAAPDDGRPTPNLEAEAEVVTYTTEGPIAFVTLARPGFANAQNGRMTYAIDDAYTYKDSPRFQKQKIVFLHKLQLLPRNAHIIRVPQFQLIVWETHNLIFAKIVAHTRITFPFFVLKTVSRKAFEHEFIAEIQIGATAQTESETFNIIETVKSIHGTNVKAAHGIITLKTQAQNVHKTLKRSEFIETIHGCINAFFDFL